MGEVVETYGVHGATSSPICRGDDSLLMKPAAIMMSPDMQSVGVATAAVVLVGAAAFALLSKKKTPPKPYEALVYKGWKAATAKGARKTTGWLASKVDGHELFWQEHRPGSTPKAALVFGHGINDHCERFNHVRSSPAVLSLSGCAVSSLARRLCPPPFR